MGCRGLGFWSCESERVVLGGLRCGAVCRAVPCGSGGAGGGAIGRVGGVLMVLVTVVGAERGAEF